MQLYLKRYNPGPIGWFVAVSIAAHALALVLITQYAPQKLQGAVEPMMVRILEEPKTKPILPQPEPVAPRSAPSAHAAAPRAVAPHAPRPAFPVVPLFPEPSAKAPSQPETPLGRGAAAPEPPLGKGPSAPEAPVRKGPVGPPKLDFSDLPPVSAPRRTMPNGTNLVDRSVIEQHAAQDERKEEERRKIGISTDDFKFQAYMRRLKYRIESVWRYPREAAERGISGDLVVEFMIKRDGTLGQVRLARTSGFPALDQAAIDAVRSAAPYWPMPSDWEEQGLIITGHFIYEGPSGKYIR